MPLSKTMLRLLRRLSRRDDTFIGSEITSANCLVERRLAKRVGTTGRHWEITSDGLLVLDGLNAQHKDKEAGRPEPMPREGQGRGDSSPRNYSSPADGRGSDPVGGKCK